MISVHDEQAVKALLLENGHKAFRWGQIEHALYRGLAGSYAEITTLSPGVRELLERETDFNTLKVASEHTSSNRQTTKFILTTHDGKSLEAVVMRHLSGRNTLCVSCQVGCPMACSFCATGKLGLGRNLTLGEIMDQVMVAARLLKAEGTALRNVVFMGMGEPMLNYDHVAAAIRILASDKKMNMSARRITVSTCGIVPGIERFGDDFKQTSLAISLHAPTDEARLPIMPVNNAYPLDVLMESLDRYVQKTNSRVFYEYIMINGQTDRPEYAQKLADLLKGRLAHVNFIPYNPGEGTASDGMRPTPRAVIEMFQRVLERAGVQSTIRATMGDDIAAACGQLALKEKESRLAYD